MKAFFVTKKIKKLLNWIDLMLQLLLEKLGISSIIMKPTS